jgi:hypothetical protein
MSVLINVGGMHPEGPCKARIHNVLLEREAQGGGVAQGEGRQRCKNNHLSGMQQFTSLFHSKAS